MQCSLSYQVSITLQGVGVIEKEQHLHSCYILIKYFLVNLLIHFSWQDAVGNTSQRKDWYLSLFLDLNNS